MSTFQNPFDGLKRNRLPGMDLITACEGGMPFTEALAAFYFMLTHRAIRHTCLIEQGLKRVEQKTKTALDKAQSPDGMAMVGIGSIMAETAFCDQEWSYLSDEDAAPYLRAAEILSNQAQIGLALGTEKIFETGYGPLVVVAPSLNDREVRHWLMWLMNQGNPNPFAGATAESWHSMGLLLFSLLHDRYEKGCKLDPDGTGVSHDHLLREWKGMPDEEQFTFLVAVAGTVEQMQRWIARNKDTPIIESPCGPILQRPQWAIDGESYFSNTYREHIAYVERMRTEVAQNSTT